jgi:6-phosphogluconolactonase
MRDRPAIKVVPDAAVLARQAAEIFARAAADSIQDHGSFTVALAGGSTPRRLYSLLAEEGRSAPGRGIPWPKIHLFWGDERHVPPDHEESNYRMAHETLISKAPIPPENVHRIPAERPDAMQAAAEYEETLARLVQRDEAGFPRLDLVLLGMGPDGHTASLFPGSSLLHEDLKTVATVKLEKPGAWRITLTPPVLNGAARILFLVSGRDKAVAAREVLEGEWDPDRLPSQMIAPRDGELIWLLDEEAAALLGRTEQGR